MITTLLALVSLGISGYQIFMHLLNYSEPTLQLYIIRILMITPVYAVSTWLSIQYCEHYLYFNVFRDMYEAYILYIFFCLLVRYMGGD